MSRGDIGRIVLVARDTVHKVLLDTLAQELTGRAFGVLRGSPQDALASGLANSVGIIVTTIRGRVDRAVMAEFGGLHTVVVPTTGIESIDVVAATEHGIAVANGATPENVNSLAEATMLLLLALLYRLPSIAVGWRSGDDRKPARTLRGKTVGIIGYGRVGKALVSLLRPFGCTVLISSSRGGMTEEGATFVQLNSLLAQADAICVTAALTKGTQHLLSKDAFSLTKPGALIVNTARGGIVDEAALYEALKEGRVAGAALDTFEVEPLPASSALRHLPQVILTPHCVGHTSELSSSFLPAMLANIENSARGDLPPYCKNVDVVPRWRRMMSI